MIIGFDAKRIVRNATGLGSYGRTLVNDLARQPGLQLRLYAPDAGRDDLRSQVAGGANVTFCYPSTPRLPFAAALWRSKYICRDLLRDGVQLFHGLSGELPIGIRRTGIRSVVTIHDLIFLRHPEYYRWLDTRIYTCKFRQALREADHIVAISECTRRDILYYADRLGCAIPSPGRISVVYQSCAPRFSAAPTAEGLLPEALQAIIPTRRYLLSVGTIEPRKNILLAVKALHHLPDDLGLVIVGRHTPYADTVRRYAEDSGLTARVAFLHGITDSTLPQLYASAEAFVYPSRYEGFGIPIIEAISSGLPVVACTGSCLEEAGGPDSLYTDPDDPLAFAAAVGRMLQGSPERQQRIARSQDYIRRFIGSDVAAQMAALYDTIIHYHE